MVSCLQAQPILQRGVTTCKYEDPARKDFLEGALHSETLLGTAKKAYLISREAALLRAVAQVPKEDAVEAEVDEAPEFEEQLAVGTLHYCFDCQSAAQDRCLNSLGP